MNLHDEPLSVYFNIVSVISFYTALLKFIENINTVFMYKDGKLLQ